MYSNTNVIFTALLQTTAVQKSYSDQTGKFPVQSSRGYNYVMILYDYDSNAILTKPIKTRQANELTKAWTSLHERLQSYGYAPTLHILDNECSEELKKAFQKYNVNFQRVPPHSHCRNSAERAVQTWKNHFCSGLATCDPKFPLTEWDLLLPQADLTLNLLRSSRRQPRLSAYACINGNFDFNRSQLAPTGTRVVVHITTEKRHNMASHGVDGWYVGPSPEHYRCHKCYIPSTFYPQRPHRRLVPSQHTFSKSHSRRVLTTNSQRHAHTHPRHENKSNSLAHFRFQYYQCLRPNRSDSQARYSSASANTKSPCSRTEGAAHHSSPSATTTNTSPDTTDTHLTRPTTQKSTIQ
jgi:hypothetical protein